MGYIRVLRSITQCRVTRLVNVYISAKALVIFLLQSTLIMSCALSTSHFCTYMAPKDTHKRCLSDERTGSPPPTKKVKGTVRRSHRAGKGSGGAADQLQKIGNVITTVQSKKTRDVFKDAGEELNPMAPESPTKRVKKVQTLWGWTC